MLATKIEDAKREEGFTLIELLVVVIIIGILAAIAIPTFLNQRERAWERATQSDLRNAAVAAEEHFNDEGTYVDFDPMDSNTSEFVLIELEVESATRYCMQATHENLDGRTFVLDSEVGIAGEGTCADGLLE